MRLPAFLILLLLYGRGTFAQKGSPFTVFGKITAADLGRRNYPEASGAVILSDIGSAEVVGNDQGWFSYKFRRHLVVHLLDPGAFGLGTVELMTYRKDGFQDKLTRLRAATYNLQNGKVVVTPLDRDSRFSEQVEPHVTLRTFTFPALKVGSIIEYEYEMIRDDFHRIEPWYFQGQYPRLWSEFRFSFPVFFNYLIQPQTYIPFLVNRMEHERRYFTVMASPFSKPASLRSEVVQYTWAVKDMPGWKEEPYLTTLENHVAKIECQLTEYREPLPGRQIVKDWPSTAAALLEQADFGAALARPNPWLREVVRRAVAGTDSLARARALYAWIRDSIRCTGVPSLYLSQPLRTTLDERRGNVCDMNLLLTAALRQAGFRADPVILSTRNGGYVSDSLPLLHRYNYVACRLLAEGQSYLLDASRPQLAFGFLPPEAYNGPARLIAPAPDSLLLYPDSLHERSVTDIQVTVGLGGLRAEVQQHPGFYGSLAVREGVAERGMPAVLAEEVARFDARPRLAEGKVVLPTEPEEPVTLRYTLQLPDSDSSRLYVWPLFTERFRQNPFAAASRQYPVELPYTVDKTVLTSFEVPAGYTVESLPRPLTLRLNDRGEGLFEFYIEQEEGIIRVRSRLRLSRAYFLPEEYEGLRRFFSRVAEQHATPIVLKKQ
ncbi:MAG TPA: transglutaminase domain-containing protein [Chitinophagaceae bacterium]|jgi:hypothetical protein|nr:transglutaminase domain-containing protein [Chitinophagaceae bacterium]